MTNFHECALLEGIVTTLNDDGTTHIAAMGPRVDWPITGMLLRPYQTSTTFKNLCRNKRGILHVTDDVLLMARAAVGRLYETPPMEFGPEGYPQRLADCVRWYAFEVQNLDESQDRTEMICRVSEQGHVRDFFGFNRARHAVIEAAILASRLHLISVETVLDQFEQYATIVDKTAGPTERTAFAELQQYLSDRLSEQDTRTMME
ncbi:DUF447 domain-containing protein [Aeoliella sp.]|uniref:DUF447 domain-containing protein n=1 Tax=Aeoliella sp. TaxID=2795800 RepID=UPI003CCB8758